MDLTEREDEVWHCERHGYYQRSGTDASCPWCRGDQRLYEAGQLEFAPRVGVPKEDITNGPHLNRRHIDGPLLSWAGHSHWLTWRERLALLFRRTTVDEVACRRWPHLARQRALATLKDHGHE